jgi:HSP20 family protein
MTTMPRQQHPLEQFHQAFESLFDRFFGNFPWMPSQEFGGTRFWDFGVTENDKEIIVRAEMPGFEEKEIDVQLNNDILTIKAEKEQKGDGQEEYRSFYRTVTLPAGIEAEKAQATYCNGVLELHFPRPAGAQAKRIQVRAHEGGNGSRGQATAAQGTTGKTTAQKGGK